MVRDSGLGLDQFLDLLIAARAITEECTGRIRTPRPDGPGSEPKMAFWFTELVALAHATAQATTPAS